MAAARGLRPRLRATRHETLIGLLAVTGMRPGEALALDRQDVDLRHGLLHVRAGKQKRQREVPLHESTIGALREYASQRDARFPAPSTPRSCGQCEPHGRRNSSQPVRVSWRQGHGRPPPIAGGIRPSARSRP
jgi:integrase